jgi:hypothetical protein
MNRLPRVVFVCTLVAGLTAAGSARAWVFSEHTSITRRAVELLEADPSTSATWHAVLPSIQGALGICERAAGACIAFEHLPSLAGDHSCTPLDLGQLARANRAAKYSWVPDVLAVAADTDRQLTQAKDDGVLREEVRRQMHIDMQGADAHYLQRALLDYSHFQLARETDQLGMDGLTAYLGTALAPTQKSNATAAYTNYHVVALRLALAASRDPAQGQRFLARAIAAEAFALHFLEDSFSTGHFVGHWGSDAVRLGTHDFYARAGLEATRWSDATRTFLAHGDAFLSDAEREVAASAVKASLAQVLSAATGRGADVVASFDGVYGFEAFDSCQSEQVAPALGVAARSPWLLAVLRDEPAPSPRRPEVARVHAEKGVFLGVAASTQAAAVLHEPGLGGRVFASFRIGFGAADIVNDPLNSQAFVDAGFGGEHLFGERNTSVTGYMFRARSPAYFVLPEGMLSIVLAQALGADCPGCLYWAAAAAGGGAGRLWKARHLAGTWYAQVSALRDFSLNYFHNEPAHGQYRTELQGSLFTVRSAVPISGGDAVAQSTDIYLDLGPSVTWSSQHHRAAAGAFLSLSVAPRLFLK